jgi:hypothetical protein
MPKTHYYLTRTHRYIGPSPSCILQHHQLGSSSVENRLLVISYERRHILDAQKTREREALLKRIRELDAEIVQHERNLREGEARLPLKSS